jgi:hypothetical protein
MNSRNIVFGLRHGFTLAIHFPSKMMGSGFLLLKFAIWGFLDEKTYNNLSENGINGYRLIVSPMNFVPLHLPSPVPMLTSPWEMIISPFPADLNVSRPLEIV